VQKEVIVPGRLLYQTNKIAAQGNFRFVLGIGQRPIFCRRIRQKNVANLQARRRERPQDDRTGYLALPGQAIKGSGPMTREEIKQKMDELAREFAARASNL
jgi:hypothetical protein